MACESTNSLIVLFYLCGWLNGFKCDTITFGVSDCFKSSGRLTSSLSILSSFFYFYNLA